MADKKTTGRQLSRRDPPQRDPETSGQQPEIKPVVDLLTSILSEVQKQVQSKTPQPLEGQAVEAVEQFRQIGAALALQPLPTITLTADPAQFGINGGTTKLTWSSTDAQKVSIDQQLGRAWGSDAGCRRVHRSSCLGNDDFHGNCHKALAAAQAATATVTVESLE